MKFWIVWRFNGDMIQHEIRWNNYIGRMITIAMAVIPYGKIQIAASEGIKVKQVKEIVESYHINYGRECRLMLNMHKE